MAKEMTLRKRVLMTNFLNQVKLARKYPMAPLAKNVIEDSYAIQLENKILLEMHASSNDMDNSLAGRAVSNDLEESYADQLEILILLDMQASSK